MESALPADVKAVLGNLNQSNEAKLALLERRFVIPPSPVASRDDTRGASFNQNSVHSCNSFRPAHTPSASRDHQLEQPERSLDGADYLPKKRRRVQPAGGVAHGTAQPAEPATDTERRTSPPAGAPRGSASPAGEGRGPAGGTPLSRHRQKNTISRYFTNAVAGTPADQQQQPGARRPIGRSPPQPEPDAVPASLSHALEEEVRSLREEQQRMQAALERAAGEKGELESAMQRLEQEAAESRERSAAREGDVRAAVLRLATACARHERERTLRELAHAGPRLGSLGVRRKGIDVTEVWEDGLAFKDLSAKLAALAEQRDSIEVARKAAKRRLPLPGQPVPADRATDAAASSGALLHPDDWVVQEEVYKVRLAAIKREEEMVRADLARLEAEKMAYIRELKRVRDEEASRFSSFPVLNNRYLLLNLLGKGGFSEVYRALDLASLAEVAVKVHQLNAQWNEAKKASYVKHAVREYHIHRALHHPRIVSLLDIFEIDNNTFATVLDLCEGGDLDAYTKLHELLPEREAKTIIAQVVSGLCYLNTKPHNIIHYDLKPANILFDANGECKITDFGLSKVVDEGQTQGMELTSQGAGTYWYLPPECFEIKSTPLISNKVDVWSVGVILYQMLFGKRPFGHDQSQEQILRNEVMLNAREVQFPSRPAISAECKDFIRSCLAYRQQDRLDVHGAAAHQFLSFKKQERRAREPAATTPGPVAP